MGRLERRSDLSSAPPPGSHETFTAVLLHDGANSPDGCLWFLGADCGVLVKKQSCRFFIAQPNEMRLSCGAEQEYSQMKA
jgi:hypothetical protein